MKDILFSVEDCSCDGLADKYIQICMDRLKVNPDDWNARVSLGISFFEKGQIREAREELEKATQAVSNNIKMFKTLGEIYEKEGNKEAAIRSFRIFSIFNADDVKVNRILSSSEAEEPAKGERTQEKPIKRNVEKESKDEMGISTNTIADIYIKQGHLDKALGTYREMLDKEPENTAIQKKIKDLMERIKGVASNEVDFSHHSSKTGRIVNTLAKWLCNLQGLREHA